MADPRRKSDEFRNIGRYKRRGEPNDTQKDCMRYRGDCTWCPNQLESQECLVYTTQEVKTFLDLSPEDQHFAFYGLS